MSTGEKIVILNVDDLESQRYVKTRDLNAAGFAVIEAQTGAEALRLVEQHKPLVVLLDVQLPDISGFEVCAFIKAKWPEVMVLQTSATFTETEDRVSGLNAGADSYLVQPAEPVELAAAINALLRVRRSEDALRTLNATLDKQVQERTEELELANRKLRQEVAQRQKVESELLQAQKMEAVGQLTGGLAHDFNNLLTAVVGNLDLIRARATEPRITRLAENAFKAAERGSKLTAQLLAFSRTQKLATESVDLNRLILDASELLNTSLGASITIKTELDARTPFVVADHNQLEVSSLNLAINARDAMPDGGNADDHHRLRRSGQSQGHTLGDGHRDGHAARCHRARLRSLLHHQACRQGDGPWPLTGLWAGEADGRRCRHQERGRQGHLDPAVSTPVDRRHGDGR